jgi:hypothetical protein
MKSKPLVAQLTKHLNEKARSLSRQSPSDLKLPRTGLLDRNGFRVCPHSSGIDAVDDKPGCGCVVILVYKAPGIVPPGQDCGRSYHRNE